MKDIHITFAGSEGTTIDLGRAAEGKELYMQKASVNIATEQGSDPIYADRGTTLLQQALSGSILSEMDATHAGNFAALDTLNFVGLQEYEAVQDSPDLIADLDLEVESFSPGAGECSFTAYYLFADGTANTETTSVTFI